jgi:hypothetical protein
MATDDRDRICPGCDSSSLGEWDEALRVFHCPTCSETWRVRPRRRHVPNVTPRLPGTVAPMTIESELPEPRARRNMTDCYVKPHSNALLSGADDV